MPADAPAQVGKAAILEWFRNERDQYEIEIDNIVREIEVSGDWGLSRGDATGTLTARDGSGSREIDSKWISVSRRMPDGSWKVHRDIYNGNDPGMGFEADLAGIAAVRTQLQTALSENDVAGIMAGLTDDHLSMPPDQPAPPDNEALTAWHQARVEQFSYEGDFTTDDVRLYGNIAIERWSGDSRVIPRGGGEDTTDSTKGVWIWERQADGSWKLLWSVWNSSLPADQGL
jgi:ketosteroid isomerase-like protein